jgi:predicted dehydrogenase
MLELAVVGLGGWGRRMVDSVQDKSDRVRFSAAVVARPERSKDFAAKHSFTVTSDYASVLRDPAVKGVVSCGPAHLHAEHALAALKAGKPVLAVKPMAKSATDALALQAAAKHSGVLLALGYDRCFFPNVAEMRNRLRSGALGRLLHAEGNFCTDRYGDIPAGNWKADPVHVTAGSLADHMLYLMIETLGPIAEVHTMSTHDVSANKLADTAAVLLRTRSNASGMLTAIGVTADSYRFHVFGTKGWLQIRDSRHLTFQSIEGQRDEMTFPEIDPVRVEVETFADAVMGRAAFPVPVEDAVHGVAVLEAMGRSAIAGHPIRK